MPLPGRNTQSRTAAANTAASALAPVDGWRRGTLGLTLLLALLAAASVLPRIDAWPDWVPVPAETRELAPLTVAIATLVIVAVLGGTTLRLQLRHARLQRAHEIDNHAALHDPMTGAANRRHFEQRLDTLVTERTPVHALLMIDLDRFKPVNDLHGHAAGDALLRGITSGLKRLVREQDLVTRLGGDEFAILLVEADARHAERTALEVLAFVGRYRLAWEGQRLRVGASVGLVAIDRAGLTQGELLGAADAALYAAKEAGRGAVFVSERTSDDSTSVGGAPTLRRLDAAVAEPVPSARSHQPVDGGRMELHAFVMCRAPAPRESMRQGSRRRREIAHRIAVEPLTRGDALAPGLSMRELLHDAALQADGGADFVRWALAMTLDAASRLTPTELGRIGFVLPLPARAVVTVPALADELLRANALSFRPMRHLTLVLHEVAAVQHDPALVRFQERLRAADVSLGVEVRACTLDVLAPLRRVEYDELHLARELTHGLSGASGAQAVLEGLMTVADARGCAVVASDVGSAATATRLAALGVSTCYGPGVESAGSLHEVLQRLKRAT